MRASWSREAGAPSLPLAGALAAGILAAVVLPVPPPRALGAALVIASAAGVALARREKPCPRLRRPDPRRRPPGSGTPGSVSCFRPFARRPRRARRSSVRGRRIRPPTALFSRSPVASTRRGPRAARSFGRGSPSKRPRRTGARCVSSRGCPSRSRDSRTPPASPSSVTACACAARCGCRRRAARPARRSSFPPSRASRSRAPPRSNGSGRPRGRSRPWRAPTPP